MTFHAFFRSTYVARAPDRARARLLSVHTLFTRSKRKTKSRKCAGPLTIAELPCDAVTTMGGLMQFLVHY